MRVVSCLNPQHIVNPHTHEHLTVACGRCRACRNSIAKRWINRLEQEKRCWKYCFFVTLTYDNENLPRLYADGCSLVDKDDFSVRIPFNDLKFTNSRDTKYFNSRINHSLGIPYARVSDIQKFHKRLNKYIHDNYTQKYQNFRYFLVSEYGKDTFRPHYHALYFFNSTKVSDHFSEILSKTWQTNGFVKGRFDAQIVQGSATSYVAQYLNSFLDLPSFYQNGKLKPFFLYSKCPSIGSLSALDSSDAKIFFAASPTRIQYDFKRNKFVDVRISDALENRLFPRCAKYSEISLPLRVSLYGLFGKSTAFDFHSFKCWLNDTFNNRYFSPKFLKYSEHGKELSNYLCWLTNNYKLSPVDYVSRESYNLVNDRLKRFYYLTKRVCTQADVFGISVFNYVSIIDEYYKNVEQLKTCNFYDSQSHYSINHDLEDVSFMYDNPEQFLINNELEYVPQIEDTFAYMDLNATSEKIYNDSTKTHKKNDYLDKCADKKLSLILKNYFEYV